MEGVVKISLEDLDSLREEVSKRRNELLSLTQHYGQYLKELELLLNFIAKKHDILPIVKEFNKQVSTGVIEYDDEDKTFAVHIVLPEEI